MVKYNAGMTPIPFTNIFHSSSIYLLYIHNNIQSKLEYFDTEVSSDIQIISDECTVDCQIAL